MCDGVTPEPEPPDTGVRVWESVDSCNKSECFASHGSQGLRPGGRHTRPPRDWNWWRRDYQHRGWSQACPCHGNAVQSMLCWSRQRDWPEHSTLDNRLRWISVVTVNPPRHKSSCPLVYLNALNQANHKADAHIKYHSTSQKYFRLRLTNKN